MSHALESLGNGEHAFAFTGDRKNIWHRLGYQVPKDLSPEQMMESAHVNWDVHKVPLTADYMDGDIGITVETGRSALIRSDNHKVLDVVTNSWNPVQNADAFAFFNDFVDAGDMHMDTAGSINDGKLVFALAKLNDGFSINGDEVGGYLLFSNPHKFGRCIDIRIVMERVVCANTLAVALGEASQHQVRVSHRREFNADKIKKMLGLATDNLHKFEEAAKVLSSKKYKDEDIVTYFQRVFPVLTTKGDGAKKLISKQAERALEIIETQPGAEFAPKSLWNMFNAVTYITNHEYGKSEERRLESLGYGTNQTRNQQALKFALEMAA